jgi:hypothetical protein
VGIPYSDPYQRITEGLGTARGVEQGFRQRQEAQRLEQKGDAEKAKVEADRNAPAPDIIKKFLTKVLNGEMDAKTASVHARAEAQGTGAPLPNMPGAQQASVSQSSPGPWAGGYGRGPMSQPAPQAQRSAQPLPAMPGEGELPIRNRDVSTLIQLAGTGNRGAANDLRELELALRARGLDDQMLRHRDLEVHRGVGDEAKKAQTANIPFLNNMKERNAGMRQQGLNIAAQGLDTRRTENFLRGAGPGLEVAAGLESLIRQGYANPEIVGNQGDYTQRRVAEVLGNLPLMGNFIESALKTGANEELTFAQRQFKQRAQAEMASYIHQLYGASLTANEQRVANAIMGGQFSVADTLVGLQLVKTLVERKPKQFQQLYPDIAGRVTTEPPPDLPAFQPDPNAPLVPDDNRGTLEFLYSPFSGGR